MPEPPKPKPDGLTITYQGKMCSPLFELSRPIGLEPGFGFVYVERGEFKDFAIKEGIPGVDVLADLKTQERTPTKRGFQSGGKLVVFEVVDGKEVGRVELEQVILSDRAIEVALEDDGLGPSGPEAVRAGAEPGAAEADPELCKIELTDIRRLWRDRGFVSAWINVPKISDESLDKAETVAGAAKANADETKARNEANQESLARQTQIEAHGRQLGAAEAKLKELAIIGALRRITINAKITELDARILSLRQDLAADDRAKALEGGSVKDVPIVTIGSLTGSRDASEGAARLKPAARAAIEQDLRESEGERERLLLAASDDALSVEDLKRKVDALKTNKEALENEEKLAAATEAERQVQLENERVAKEKATPKGGGAQSKESKVMIPGSLDGGKPWTLKRVLTQKVLPQLPGAPRLRYIAEDLGDRVVSAKRWDVVLAKRALAELLDEFHADLSLDLGASVSVWKRNEGVLQLEDGQVVGYDAANVDDRVASARRLLSYDFTPPVAVVVGPPVIVAARMALEAVGVRDGKIVPLAEALEGIGFSRQQGASFALLVHEQRAALLGVTKLGLKEFERWAWKWFRLPGGVESHGDKLPILDARAATGKAGELLPLRVFSETHCVVSVLDAALKAARSTANKLGAKLSDDVVAAFKAGKAKHFRAVKNLGFGEQASGFEIDQKRGLVKFSSVQGLVKRLGSGVTLGTVSDAELAAASASAAADEAAEAAAALAAASKARSGTLDEERAQALSDAAKAKREAVDALNAAKAAAQTGGVDELPALDEAQLLERDPAVELEFAFTRKPGLKDALSLVHRYHSVWVRKTTDDKVELEQRPELPEGTAPIVISNPNLQQVVRIDGTTNKGELDAVARRLAEEQLLVSKPAGSVVEFCRPVAVKPCGAVPSVTWFTDDERPRVVAHVGGRAPLQPRPEFKTRAFGGRFVEDNVLRGSVIVPQEFAT